ncbi:hypothetical protein J7J83_04600 [bacterium]|nr:hypothetical protein [bacterium]
MNKNYFSDITDLFFKVKNEENIQIDESEKAKIKNILQTRINEIKNVKEHKQDSFWNKWRYQLIGAPASLLALVLALYATTNLNVSIPKEDFSPTPPAKPPVLTDFDRPLVKTAPKLETKPPRTLNKIQENETDFKLPKTKYNTTATSQETQAPVEPENTKSKDTREKPATSQETTVGPETVKPRNTVSQNTQKDIPVIMDGTDTTSQKTTDTTTTNTQKEPATSQETTVEPEETTSTVKPENTVSESTSTKITTSSLPIIKKPTETSTSPIYIHKDKTIKSQSAFNKENLAKLTSSKTPDSTTVYYISDNQVIVEIDEDGITKWYLFDKIKDNWTISKYKKFRTKTVVK